MLAAHHLSQMARRYRKAVTGFDPPAVQAMRDHLWPGNVRELNHVIERAVLMAPGTQIRTSDLALRPPRDAAAGKLEEMSLEEVEGFLIKKTLSRYNGNVSQAAGALGLSRSALYRRIQRYGI